MQSLAERKSMASTNLPVQLTSFIGRQRDLAVVERLLSTARLVTFTGAGGCGKTRLAIQLAGTVSDTFGDGAWLVDLAPLREAGLVPQLVAQALGLRPVPDQPLLEALLSFVRPKQLLLILDNCEHLSDACTQLARQLLSQAPELCILATSREPLAILGETIYKVSGLAWPSFGGEAAHDRQSSRDPKDLLQYDAVRLFVERARAISPNFTLTSENGLAVVEICRRLDGLPLAIELASARANVLTVQEIALRLDDRFALLTSAQRTGLDPRYLTLRAAIDWSHALLASEEQLLLRRLAVFAAGCTLDTAETVCSGEGIAEGRTLDLLSSLVDKSLVIAETTGRAQAHYRLLETIREYALEKLEEAGEAARLRDRHLDLYLARAEEAAPKLQDSYQQLWLSWLEGEHDNLRAALAWALESGRIEPGLRIASGLVRFWEIRGHVQEGFSWFERLLAQADEQVPVDVRVNALVFTTFLAMFLGNGPATVSYSHEAVSRAEAAYGETDPMLVFALSALASAAQAAGDNATAFITVERTIRTSRESGPPSFLGMALIVGGGIAIELGYYDIARARLEEGLALAREAGDAFRSAYALNSLGDLARCEENYAEAQTNYENAVALLRELGAKHDLASPLQNLGHACLHLGDVERAHALFNESLVAHQAHQNVLGIADCLIGFGAVAVVRGSPAVGVRLLAAGAIGGRRVKSSWATTQMECERYLALARGRLTEAQFQAEQAAGRAMSVEQAIEYAQNFLNVSGAALATPGKAYDLSAREREVAALIAWGKTNREIADELVLSTRTVEKHAANILSKLGLSSRTQIVHWAIGHGLIQASSDASE
jgi:non-specific serine/threonine protein kinase